ncbi:(2Fe-2S)-binding protein [Kumtagia ephedrae]|uniref:(2Fe-2S)-binding protein n=1 Tax=Kumtagia ephedrae TaxID=2116701 RepID=A0A2P7S0Y7_9HYPH|nr:(2Fe-2S)-binding protein [Mesorhizobium ephedrae]PSJ56135.1 (2Fe-2S)-binding protein [Mesorhizobium ephedrae]
MTHQNPAAGKAGTDKQSRAVAAQSDPTSITRRTVLQIAGSAVSLAAVTPAAAQAVTTQPSMETAARPVRLLVNGNARELPLDPRQSLLDVLRETLDLTGTKKGCNQGACGACTVLVNGKRIVSCLTLASLHDGAHIETIEGLSKDGELHPLQQAFIDHEGLQCGFCTSGQIMSGIGCISEGHAGSPEEIRFWMSGNICRCGAYPGIVAAVADTAQRS